MRTQEQAFRAYYASMTDAELLTTGRNRGSFIPLAQTILTEELQRRHLTPPADTPETVQPRTLLTELRRLLRRGRSEPSAAAKTGRVQPAGIVAEPTSPPVPKSMGPPPPIDISGGATEDQVHMAGIVPERINKEGTKVEDLAGTGEHDSLGG
jgi:hypothetical protein